MRMHFKHLMHLCIVLNDETYMKDLLLRAFGQARHERKRISKIFSKTLLMRTQGRSMRTQTMVGKVV